MVAQSEQRNEWTLGIAYPKMKCKSPASMPIVRRPFVSRVPYSSSAVWDRLA